MKKLEENKFAASVLGAGVVMACISAVLLLALVIEALGG